MLSDHQLWGINRPRAASINKGPGRKSDAVVAAGHGFNRALTPTLTLGLGFNRALAKELVGVLTKQILALQREAKRVPSCPLALLLSPSTTLLPSPLLSPLAEPPC